jgi:DNA-3-methyladenine glycosylase
LTRTRLPPLVPSRFFARDALEVARDLLGRELRRGPVRLRITEVEAYRPGDSANHARAGRTRRNEAMWGEPGRAYVYLCYGIHSLLNVVTGESGDAQAVLVRSCEPIAGIETIRERRGGRDGPDALTGPGKVGAALALDPGWCGHRLYRAGGLELREGPVAEEVLAGPRIGIDYAKPADRDAPWRLAAASSRWIGHRRALQATARPTQP